MKSFLVIKKAKTSVSLLLALFAMAAFILPGAAQASGLVDQDYLNSIVDTNPNPVPHWATPEDEAYIQQLQEGGVIQPLGVEVEEPPSGTILTPAEYDAVLGPLVAWEPGSYLSLLTEFVVGVTTDSNGSIAYVIVSGSSQQASATSTLSGAGANISRVEFLYYNLDTVWIRDYGPRYILEDGLPAIIDHTYNRNRPADNAFPDSIDDMDVPFEQDEPVYLMDLTHGGGNFHVFSNGDAFMSSLILEENSSKSQAEIESIIESYFNVNVTIYNRLPSNVDATGHIDMWFLPVGDNKVIIGEFAPGAPGYTQTEAAAADMASRGYTVYRTPSYNSGSGGTGGTHYTYTNAAIVNNRVYIPEYGGTHAADDATALAVFQAAMPDHEIIQVNCSSIISAAGAIHCVMKHVYSPLPTAPTITSTPVTIGGVGHLYSYDVDASGCPAATFSLETYPAGMTIDPNTGLIEWTPSSTGDVNVVVRATNSEGYDEQNFTISVSVITEVVYDFSSGAGTIHHAYGTYSDDWASDLDGYRTHAEYDTEVTTIAADAYDDLAYSDATGGDTDPGRYQNPDEGYNDESTMTCEFYISEDRTEVTQLDVFWEGYGDASRHMELYIWNYAQGNWGDLNGNTGENNFIDDGTASDTDMVLEGSTTSNITDYIDTDGEITLLIYMDSSSEDSRHDYVSVTIHTEAGPVIQTLSVSSTSGGSVTIPGEGDYQYAQGTDANIVATADLHYHFVNWTGTAADEGKVTDPNSAATTVTMDANYTVQANFAIDTFTLEYAAGPGGSLTGETSQVVDYDANGTPVTAVPDTGYHFVDWSDASTDNPRTDLNVTANISVTANFAIDTFTLDYTAGAGGSISGETSQVVDYNTNGTPVTAVPDTGYHFVDWSDASTDNPRTDLNVTANIAVTANFAIDTFTLDYTAGAGGSISGETSQVVDYNTNGTPVTAVPDIGYYFVNWSDVSTENPRTDVNVTANISVTANFAIYTFTLDYAAGPGGSLTGDTSQVVNYDANGTSVTAVPDTGYHFVNWSDASTDNPRTDLHVTANISVTANFAIDTFTLDYTAGPGGSLTGETSQVVDYNTNGTPVTAAPDTGYHFVDWSDAVTDNPRTDLNVTANISVTANFAVNQYTISGNTGVADVNLEGLGVVSDGSGNYTKTVDYGWSGTVTPSKAGYTFTPTSRTYTDVAEDHIGDDYTATLLTYTISGNTGVGDVMLGGLGIVSDGSGNYTKTVDYGWSGMVTPSKAGYTFAPTSRTYINVAEDHIGDDYTATLNTYTISGYIMNDCNEPIEGVLVDANNGGGEDATDANGFYEVEVDYDWSGDVTPSKEQYTFEPNVMSYVGVSADQPDQDYDAYHIYDFYDLDYDCHIGWGDVAIISENWLIVGDGLPGDFYEDDANTVNFLDFADFANIWKD